MALLVTNGAALYAQQAQLSPSAYRALGQPDLRQNGVNMVQANTASNGRLRGFVE